MSSAATNRLYRIAAIVFVLLLIGIGMEGWNQSYSNFSGFSQISNITSSGGFMVSGNPVLNIFVHFYMGLILFTVTILSIYIGGRKPIITGISTAVFMLTIELLSGGVFYPAFPTYFSGYSSYIILSYWIMSGLILIQIYFCMKDLIIFKHHGGG